ncbi:hypothetical protein OPKNFCMD_6532 [Methylobacterium crusticola]|uniref:Uncharacterized protein n=1 Tax=Methylobacterium crusticola TaxID=1697972 RepID=A0ABQ4R9H1_9HYPH|nr:hypothetical protein [Methylobacterium crusticola]GJD53754.1 hypothetical protein OPKNFCMD_6532 [Methylobacterium crusticola]
MHARLARAALLAAVALPLGAAGHAAAQSPAQDYAYQQPRLRQACRPPLKFAAGACVRRCPAGYRNIGGYCRQRDGGGW